MEQIPNKWFAKEELSLLPERRLLAAAECGSEHLLPHSAHLLRSRMIMLLLGTPDKYALIASFVQKPEWNSQAGHNTRTRPKNRE